MMDVYQWEWRVAVKMEREVREVEGLVEVEM